jgi:hypothetical protein
MIDLLALLVAAAPLLGPAEARLESRGNLAEDSRTAPIVGGKVSGSCRTSVGSPPRPGRLGTYSAARVLGLLFRTALADPAEAPRLRLRLYSPDGHLYQVVRYRAPRAAPSSSMRPSPPPRAFEASVPIAGSQILWGSLYGRWTAVTTLEGDPGSCGSPVSFVIQP